MKMKSFFLPALALALFAACSGEEALTSENKVQQTTQDDAVTFDAYLNRSVTRGGYAGTMTTSTGLRNLRTEGFGVFGYYSDGELYSENAIPDFMYNQQVSYSGGKWEYSPLKYWPNEFGSSAVSTGVDRVTFFAYAPYVSVDPATGQLTSYYDDSDAEHSTETGITALTRNGKSGDPYVRYVGAFDPANSVDLLYGVAAEDFKSYVGALDGANNIKAGDPFINVAKPEIGAKLKFNFKHALAKLTVNVDADVDIVSHDEGDAFKDDNTRIWIRSITFDGIAPRGYLNLNNGMWYEVMSGNKISHSSVTVYDGRRDGAESIAEDEYETPIGINPKLIQSDTYKVTLSEDPTTKVPTYVLETGALNMTTTPGVTIASKELFGDASHDLLVIPANEQVKVTIVYDVETVDATLPNYLSDGVTKGSTVENRITKAITLGGSPLKLDAGKAYTLNLHLGMTSVKFDAEVSDWADAEEVTADDTWLPINGPTHAAIENPTSKPVNITLSAEAHTYEFAISGLKSSEAVTAPTVADPITSATNNAANASGLAVETIGIAENKTVSDRVIDATWTGNTSGKGVSLKITQAAGPLGLGVSAVAADGKSITLGATATGANNAFWDAATITVSRNRGGVITELTKGTKTAGSKFELDGTNKNKIVLADADEVKAGDIYTITVNPGEGKSAPETATAKIGGIAFVPDTYSIEYGTTGDSYTPTIIGQTPSAYSYTASPAGTYASVNATTGVITTVAANAATTKISATATQDADDDYFYTTNSKKAEYDLTVTKAAGTITYANDSKAITALAENTDAGTYTAKLKNSHGDELADGGTIEYSIDSVKKGDVPLDNGTGNDKFFKLNTSSGALTVGTEGLDDSSTYTVVLKATVTGNDNAGYTDNSAKATITITTP